MGSGTAVAAVIFAALIAGFVYRYWPSDERSIRRHLSNLAEALSLSSAESEALSLTRFAALREYFEPDVHVRVDSHEITSREALLDALRSATPPPGGVAVEFVDVTVRVADDRGTALVDLTAKVSTERTPTAEASLETRRVNLSMTKRDGDWVIAEINAGPTR